jgi:hypothetical protein
MMGQHHRFVYPNYLDDSIGTDWKLVSERIGGMTYFPLLNYQSRGHTDSNSGGIPNIMPCLSPRLTEYVYKVALLLYMQALSLRHTYMAHLTTEPAYLYRHVEIYYMRACRPWGIYKSAFTNNELRNRTYPDPPVRISKRPYVNSRSSYRVCACII